MTNPPPASAESTNPPPASAESWVGRRLELTVGPVAHGGHFVARHDGRVVFVRHALTGERVVAVVTEDGGGSFCRADAVTILQLDTDRVPQPCSYAHPGGCGGCDFQHVALPRQRALKAAVIAEQFSRLAGIDLEVEVQPLPSAGTSPDTGLGWRRRIRYAVADDGQLGLRVHRSHQILQIDRCPLGTDAVGHTAAIAEAVVGRSSGRPAGIEVEAAEGDGTQDLAVLAHPPASRVHQRRAGARGHGRRPAEDARRGAPELIAGPQQLHYTVNGRRFTVRSAGFWQTHPGAAAAFSAVLAQQTGLRAGGRALDLYAGAGLFTALLAEQVTDSGRILGLDSDSAAVSDAEANLADLDQAQLRRGSVTPASVRALAEELGGPVDCVVLDPPRTGAGRDVMRAITDVTGKVVVYVACDPAALARDVRTAVDAGWELTDLRAFDAFPMTHHVESIATLQRRR